jgi:hypothetical protein
MGGGGRCSGSHLDQFRYSCRALPRGSGSQTRVRGGGQGAARVRIGVSITRRSVDRLDRRDELARLHVHGPYSPTARHARGPAAHRPAKRAVRAHQALGRTPASHAHRIKRIAHLQGYVPPSKPPPAGPSSHQTRTGPQPSAARHPAAARPTRPASGGHATAAPEADAGGRGERTTTAARLGKARPHPPLAAGAAQGRRRRASAGLQRRASPFSPSGCSAVRRVVHSV